MRACIWSTITFANIIKTILIRPVLRSTNKSLLWPCSSGIGSIATSNSTKLKLCKIKGFFLYELNSKLSSDKVSENSSHSSILFGEKLIETCNTSKNKYKIAFLPAIRPIYLDKIGSLVRSNQDVLGQYVYKSL